MSDFDPAKDEANIAKHGVSLALAFEMDPDLMITFEDRRFAYNEDRWISIGPIGDDLFVLAHTYRGDRIRPISLRRAEKHERKLYRESWT
jgi:uncharacterized protein